MRATNRIGAARGIVMLMVIILVALLIIIALIIASGAFNAETSAQAVAVKYRVLNSAEGGANAALNQLAENAAAIPTCYPGTLNGKTFSGCIEVNNLNNNNSTKSGIDPATGNSITVAKNSAYIYGESSFNGGRKVYIEAIAALAPPITLPFGAINAAGTVNDQSSEPISSDTKGITNNANVSANGDILVSGGAPSIVQGVTSAVGTDNLPGTGSPSMNSGANSILFPNVVQLQQAAQNAKSIAQAGSSMLGATLVSGGTVTGNAFIDGDLNLSSGTVTFTNGSYVFINGNVCVSGTGALANMNSGQNIVVVNGVISVKSAAGFMTAAQQNSLLLVMGADPGPMGPCGGAFAVDLEQPSGVTPVGTIYAATGSVFLGGSAALTGALDAGRDVIIAGTPASNFIYDTTQAKTTVTTGTLTYTAYNEN